MYKYIPWVNNVYLKHKKRHWYKTWIEVFKMRQNHYDLAIDDTVIRLHRTIYTMIINPKYVIACAGKAKRYGFDRSQLSFYYKTYPITDLSIHIVDERLKALDLLGIKNYDNKMLFPLPKENDEINDFISKFKDYKLIGLNTDASHEDRTLSTEQIVTLCKLLERKDIKIIPFSVPKKLEYFKTLIKENNLKNVEIPLKTNSIFEAAQVLEKLDLLITPDTSFVHIASGLNIPVIGLFWNYPSKYILCAPRSDISVALTPKGKEENLKNIDLRQIQKNAFEILNIKE